MPLIKPRKGETKETFISRFMSNPISIKEFPDQMQRYAVAINIWKEAHK